MPDYIIDSESRSEQQHTKKKIALQNRLPEGHPFGIDWPDSWPVLER